MAENRLDSLRHEKYHNPAAMPAFMHRVTLLDVRNAHGSQIVGFGATEEAAVADALAKADTEGVSRAS